MRRILTIALLHGFSFLWVATGHSSAFTQPHASSGVEHTPLSVPQSENVSPPTFVPSASFAPETPITAVGNVNTIHLVKNLTEWMQRVQPSLLIDVRSVDTTATPEWWNLSAYPTVGIFVEPMSQKQVAQFQRERNGRPLRLSIGMASVVVVVHKTNPIADTGLTLAQLDAIFSRTRLRGHTGIHYWGDVGVAEESWQRIPITPIGQNATSDVARYFKREALKGGDIKNDVARVPDSALVAFEVANDRTAIGFALRNAVSKSVKIVPLASEATTGFLLPTVNHVHNGEYPFVPSLLIYCTKDHVRALDRSVKILLQFILSRQGQDVLGKRGYVPLTAEQIWQERHKIDS